MTIEGHPARGDELFNYVGRNIELFYVRYLEIKGLSVDLAYEALDERTVPSRCRRPYDKEYGIGEGGWEDRPCHNRFFPEIAVPLELHTPFTIPLGTSQAIWGDIYIPRNVPSGVYTGTLTISEEGRLTWEIPVELQVRNFTLPDLPTAKTMIFISRENIYDRYLGLPEEEIKPGTAVYTEALKLLDRHFQLAHRHKVSLIDGYLSLEQMEAVWPSRLDGSLFTPEQGYEGVGEGVGNNVYSIGTYGSWPWREGGREEMWRNSDAWVNWFDKHPLDIPTEYFLYLIDESREYAQTERWARWLDENPGPGRRLMSMATLSLPDAARKVPSLDVVASPAGWGAVFDLWQPAVERYVADPHKRFYLYNGKGPLCGSFAIEDDGVALRMLPWAQFKMKVDRWFYWESTYYNNFQCAAYNKEQAQTNVFRQAQTFGCRSRQDRLLGETGWNYFNGDGVLFYPGTDRRFPKDSYGVKGPFASLRLKLWRRGIQDADYLALAAAIDPERTNEIVKRIVPKVLWEYDGETRADVSWPIDPDVWEAARKELADIIEGGTSRRSGR